MQEDKDNVTPEEEHDTFNEQLGSDYAGDDAALSTDDEAALGEDASATEDTDRDPQGFAETLNPDDLAADDSDAGSIPEEYLRDDQ